MYIIVVGCGRVGSQLAELLSLDGHDVVIIDKDSRAFRRLGAAFNGVTMEGVGFDEEVLKSAGIEKADALVAVTDLDNTNMMIAEVATKIFNVPKVVARLYNPEREGTYQQLGLDYVCGTILVAEKILERVVGNRIHHLVLRRDIEIIEFELGKEAWGRRVKDIELPGEFKIIGIVRGASDILPSPDEILEENDVLLAAVRRGAFPKIKGFMI